MLRYTGLILWLKASDHYRFLPPMHSRTSWPVQRLHQLELPSYFKTVSLIQVYPKSVFDSVQACHSGGYLLQLNHLVLIRKSVVKNLMSGSPSHWSTARLYSNLSSRTRAFSRFGYRLHSLCFAKNTGRSIRVRVRWNVSARSSFSSGRLSCSYSSCQTSIRSWICLSGLQLWCPLFSGGRMGPVPLHAWCTNPIFEWNSL